MCLDVRSRDQRLDGRSVKMGHAVAHEKRMRISQFIRYSASILYKSIVSRYRPVSYPDGPIKQPAIDL